MADTTKDHVIGRCSASLRGSGTLLGALLDYIPMSSWPTTFVSSSRIARAADGSRYESPWFRLVVVCVHGWFAPVDESWDEAWSHCVLSLLQAHVGTKGEGMRIAMASFSHEIFTFCPTPMTVEDFAWAGSPRGRRSSRNREVSRPL
jgi:hypothetical protein